MEAGMLYEELSGTVIGAAMEVHKLNPSEWQELIMLLAHRGARRRFAGSVGWVAVVAARRRECCHS
jgi:hypothetical protein